MRFSTSLWQYNFALFSCILAAAPRRAIAKPLLHSAVFHHRRVRVRHALSLAICSRHTTTTTYYTTSAHMAAAAAANCTHLSHRHSLIHNHNHIKLHLLCPFQSLLHCPTALLPPGRLCNHPSRHRNPHTQPQCFHPQHLPLRTCCHNYIPHHLQNLPPPRRSTHFQHHNKQQLPIIHPQTHSAPCSRGFGNPTQHFPQSHNLHNHLHLNLCLRHRLH